MSDIHAQDRASERTSSRYQRRSLSAISQTSPASPEWPTTPQHRASLSEASIPASITSEPPSRAAFQSVPTDADSGTHHDAHVYIVFASFVDNDYQESTTHKFNTSKVDQIEAVARKFVENGECLFNSKLWALHASDCYKACTMDNTNTIIRLKAGRININRQLCDAVARYCAAQPLRKRIFEGNVDRDGRSPKRVRGQED